MSKERGAHKHLKQGASKIRGIMWHVYVYVDYIIA